MLKSRPNITWRWFAAVALVSMLFASTIAGLVWMASGLLLPKVGPIIVEPEVASGKETIRIEQLNPGGEPIPWGGTANGADVWLRILPLQPEQYSRVAFVIAGSLSPVSIRADMTASGAAILQQNLEPGGYRWHTVLMQKNGTSMLPVQRDRTDPQEPDFIVPQTPLRLRSLQQYKFNEEFLSVGGKTEHGVLVVGVINKRGGWLEVEAKPVGMAFQETEVRAEIVGEGGQGRVALERAPGSYRWRARGRGPDGSRTDWLEFADNGAAADFVILQPRVQRPPPGPPASRLGGTSSLSSAGSGDRNPRPSIVDPLDPLWKLLTSLTLMIGLVAALAGVAGFWVDRRVRARRQRKGTT